MLPFIILSSTMQTNFKPVKATNNKRTIPNKRTLKLSSQWTMFRDHYRNHPLHVRFAPNVLYSNFLTNYGRMSKPRRHIRIYHMRQRERNCNNKRLTPQSQFVPWDKDDIIKGHKHTILHLPHLMINR